MSQSHERLEKEEVQDGKGLLEALDSKERIHTERIVGKIFVDRPFGKGLYQQRS